MMHIPTDIDKRFVANMKCARKMLGLRQIDVAEQMQAAGFAEFSQATMFVTERAFRPLRLSEADELSRILGVPFDRMISEPPSRIRAIVRDSLQNGVHS